MAKKKAERGYLDTVRRMRAIRRLARTFPRTTLDDRLDKIVGIANGSIAVDDLRPPRKVIELDPAPAPQEGDEE